MPKRYPEEWLKYGYTQIEWESFHKSKKWRIRYPGKQGIATKSWVSRNLEYRKTWMRTYQLKKLYGVTDENYQTLLKQQDHKCAICGVKEPAGKWKVFHIDHDHNTNLIRGLLCNNCNRGIGYLGDSSVRLRLAADYLDNHKIKTKKDNSK